MGEGAPGGDEDERLRERSGWSLCTERALTDDFSLSSGCSKEVP